MKFAVLKSKVARKLVLSYILIICLPLLAFSVLWYNQSRSSALRTVELRIENNLVRIRDQMSSKSAQLVAVSRNIALNPQIISYLQGYSAQPDDSFLALMLGLGSFISDLSEINQDIRHLNIYAFDENIPRYRDIIYPVALVREFEWYSTVDTLAYDSYYFSGLHGLWDGCDPGEWLVSPSADNPQVFSLYRKLYSTGTTPIAFLAVSVDVRTLLGAAVSDRDIGVCVWEDGRGVIHSENDPGGLLETKIAAMASADVWEDPAAELGDASLYYISSIDVPEPSLRVYLAYPHALISGEADRNTRVIFIFFGLGAVLVSIFLFMAFHSLPRRLSRLVVRMESIRDQRWDIDITPERENDERRNDEIAQINRTLHQLVRTVYTSELAEKEAKLSYLQAQLDPHFLFNALESIRMAATLGKNAQVSDALLALSNILRVRIHSDELITLEAEVEIIRSYISVENIRFGGRISLEVNVSHAALWTREIPSLIIQPLAENAVKHGMRPDRRPLLVKLTVTQTADGTLCVSMMDDGKGMDEKQLEEVLAGIRENRPVNGAAGNGVGLVNLAERLRLYYGELGTLRFTSISGVGSQVDYHIPPGNIFSAKYPIKAH